MTPSSICISPLLMGPYFALVQVLSPEELVSCGNHDGCRGGSLSYAWNFIKEKGLVSDSCFPYTAGQRHTPTPSCLIQNKTCPDAEPYKVARHHLRAHLPPSAER